jgi:AcrR family transcriptional regulator
MRPHSERNGSSSGVTALREAAETATGLDGSDALADPSERAVLAAAALVFAEQGLRATLADVAKRARVGVASVYRRFANKDDLICVVYEPRLAAAYALLRDALNEPDAWSAFEGYYRASLRTVVEDKGFRELTLGAYSGTLGWSRSGSPQRLMESVTRTETRMRPLHVELVRKAQASSALRPDMDPSDMLVLTMAALSTAEFAGGAFPGLADRVATVILDGLRTERAALTALPSSPLSDADIASVRTGARR